MPNSTLQKRSRRYSVLVSDDSDECRETLGELLEADGFEAFLACNGEEAMTIFQRELIDLLVMDMLMPGLSGLQTLQMIRQRSRRPVPCIFITATDSPELRRQAMQAEAFTVLPKPISADLVRAAVRLALKKYF